MGCLPRIPILSRGLVVPLDTLIERLMSDTLEEEDMPYIEFIFDAFDEMNEECPLATFEEKLDDAIAIGICDGFRHIYGDIIFS